MEEYKKMINGELFKPKLVAKEYYDTSLRDCQKYNMIPCNKEELKKNAIKCLLGKSEEHICVVQPFQCSYSKHISVGNHFFANTGCVMLAEAGITFGNDVLIGPNCVFTSVEHPIDAKLRKEGYDFAKPICVGNNVWFGAGCIVLSGVTIGDNAVIGAGSVVIKDIPADVVAVGNPCKVIKEIKKEGNCESKPN